MPFYKFNDLFQKEVDDEEEEEVNNELSDLKIDAKDEDKDSGLKIEEESKFGSDDEYDYWTECSFHC